MFPGMDDPYKLKPQDVEYLEAVKAQSLTFQIPTSEDAVAWERAREILTKYGHRMGGRGKLRASTNVMEMSASKAKYVIRCEENSDFAYRIVRESRESIVEYTVSYCAWISEIGPSDDSERGKFSNNPKGYARFVAYYIVSGKKKKRAIWPYG
jgi:hypothetical protein